jgi:ParB family chromosome partitioning protein
VTNSLRLLKLDPRVQQMVIEDKISAGHARALLAIEISEEQYLLAMKVFDERLSVRETERLVKLHTQKKPERKKAAEDHRLDYIYEDMEAQLRAALGTKVILNRKTPQKGKIEIEYYSSEELERLYDLLRILKQN